MDERPVRRQFAQSEQGLLLVAEDFLDRAQAGDFCFVEDRSPAPWLDRLEEVRLYRWGRVYPADVWLGLDLADGWPWSAGSSSPAVP